jgi:hypothetical protein
MSKKVVCAACVEKVEAGALAFNEAEHNMNVCTECAQTVEDDVRGKKIAALVKKGIDAKVAKKKVAAMDLEPAVLKALVKLIEEEEGSADVDETDIEVGGDQDEDELEDELATRKPKTTKKDKVVTAPVAPVKPGKKAPAVVLSPRQQKLADRAARKAAKEAAAAALAAPVKPGKKVKAVAEPVKVLSARQIKLAARAARREAKAAGTVAPPVKAGKTATPATAAGITVALDAERIAKLVRIAIREAKETLATMKLKKTDDAAEILHDLATAGFEVKVGNALLRGFEKLAKESGLSKTIRSTISAA